MQHLSKAVAYSQQVETPSLRSRLGWLLFTVALAAAAVGILASMETGLGS